MDLQSCLIERDFFTTPSTIDKRTFYCLQNIPHKFHKCDHTFKRLLQHCVTMYEQKNVQMFNDHLFLALLTQLGKADQVGTRWHRSRSIRMTITHDWSPFALAFSAVKSRLVNAQMQRHTTWQSSDRGATLLFTMEAFKWFKNRWTN